MRHCVRLAALTVAASLAACGGADSDGPAEADGSEPGQGIASTVTDGTLDGSYHCVFFIGGSGLQTVPGFSISGSGYTHEDGSSGTVAFDGATVEFSGGALNGQAGIFESGTPARVRLYNEERSRTVIDCDRQ